MAACRLAWLSLSVLVVAVLPATATTIVVSSTADDIATNGNCTLREAIIAANTDAPVDGCPAGSGADTIVLSAGVYRLTIVGNSEDLSESGDLDVPSELAIHGEGLLQTIIDVAQPVEPYIRDRVVHVTASGTLSLEGVTIQGGYCWGGGGILNEGRLLLTDTQISGNLAGEDAECWPYAGDGGGGILNASGGVLVAISTDLFGNHAGGFDGDNNTAFPGGGLANYGNATISSSQIVGNFAAAGGGIYNVGGLTVVDTAVTGNGSRFRASALWNGDDASMLRTSMTGNYGGTTISTGGVLRLDNVTVSGNENFYRGGSIDATGGLYVTNATIAQNTPEDWVGGISGGGTIELTNTILANAGGNCSGPVASRGYNVATDDTCSLIADGDLTNTDPLLGFAADNGGWTPTHALLAGSPAIDRIPQGSCAVGTDQRGVARPDSGPAGACDVGAYEFTPVPVVTITSPMAASFREGAAIRFSGTAVDHPGGHLTSLLTWSSDVMGVIGTGASFSATLAPGVHIITAAVTDADGLTGSASLSLEVVALGTTQTTFTSVAAEDGFVAETGEGTNAGGFVDSASGTTVALQVGDLDNDAQVKSFLSFDTSQIPDGATITSATLLLRRSFVRGVNPFTTHGPALIDVRQGAFGGNAALQASDFQAAATVTSATALSSPAANGDWASAALSPMAIAAINATGTTQLRIYFAIEDDDDNVRDFIAFRSGNDLDPASRPQLIVTYASGGGNTAPSVAIASPLDGAAYAEGTIVSFTGTAVDPESGNLTGALQWHSTVDGAIGSGGNFSRMLSPGAHVITASVTDSGGLQGTSAIALTVTLEPPSPPTSLLAVSPTVGTVRLTWTDTSTNETGFQIGLGNIDQAPPDLAILATVPANTTSWDWTMCSDPGVSHHWYVRSIRTGLSSAWFGPIGQSCDGGSGGVTDEFVSIAADDGLIAESAENSNAGGLVDAATGTVVALQIGDLQTDAQVKSLLSFDTSSLPDGATIVSATLRIRRGLMRGSNPFATHGAALVDIRQGAFGDNAALQAGDFQATATAAAVASFSTPAADGDWAEATLTGPGAAALNRSGLTQFRIYFAVDDDDDGIRDVVGFRSGNDVDAASRPQLIVTYQP